LQIVVLVNPLVYMCEGFRLALTSGVDHMPVWAIYGGMIVFTVVLAWVGIDGFRRRVQS
jgi:ABC-2 type transport system permease protein